MCFAYSGSVLALSSRRAHPHQAVPPQWATRRRHASSTDFSAARRTVKHRGIIPPCSLQSARASAHGWNWGRHPLRRLVDCPNARERKTGDVLVCDERDLGRRKPISNEALKLFAYPTNDTTRYSSVNFMTTASAPRRSGIWGTVAALVSPVAAASSATIVNFRRSQVEAPRRVQRDARPVGSSMWIASCARPSRRMGTRACVADDREAYRTNER